MIHSIYLVERLRYGVESESKSESESGLVLYILCLLTGAVDLFYFILVLMDDPIDKNDGKTIHSCLPGLTPAI